MRLDRMQAWQELAIEDWLASWHAQLDTKLSEIEQARLELDKATQLYYDRPSVCMYMCTHSHAYSPFVPVYMKMHACMHHYTRICQHI